MRLVRIREAKALDKTLTADDILPLVASLTPQERVRLLRLIVWSRSADAAVYEFVPPSRDEFSTDEEPLAMFSTPRRSLACCIKVGELMKPLVKRAVKIVIFVKSERR
jgi:hypothetical protein